MAAKKRSPSARRAANPRRPWDPSAVPPAESSPMEDGEREFHATHFTADPRGKGKTGSTPGDKSSKRRRGGAK